MKRCPRSLLHEPDAPRLLSAFVFFLFFLGGCEKKPNLPVNYGLYIEEGGTWRETVNSGGLFHKLSPKPSFLIFRREVGFTKSVDEVAAIHPVHLITRNVEEIRTEERKEIIGYTLEEASSPITATGVVVGLSISPIQGHPEMLIVSPKDPLVTGLYEFSAFNQNYQFGVSITDPKQLPSAQKVDKWFHTLAIKNQGSWDAWRVVSERGVINDDRYKGRMLERSEICAQSALEDTKIGMRKRFLEKSDYFEKMKIANLWRGIDGAAQVEIERLNNELMTTLTRLTNSKEYYLIVAFEEKVREVSPTESRFKNIFATANREIEKRETQSREEIRGALSRCQQLGGANICPFTAIQGQTRDKAEEGTVKEDGIFWQQKALSSIERGSIRTCDIASVKTEEKSSVWDGRKYWGVTVVAHSQTEPGRWGHSFDFDSKQAVEAFIGGVANAKALWEQKYRTALTTKHTASSQVWGEKIWLNQVNFASDSKDPAFRTCKVRMSQGATFDIEEFFSPTSTFSRKDDWIQIISTNGKDIQFTVTRLPYFGPTSAQLPADTAQGASTTHPSVAREANGNNKLDAEKLPAQPEAAVKAPNDAKMVGERFPETRLRLLNGADLSRMDAEGLRYAINEMYARHGADIKNDTMRQQFAKLNWYHPIFNRSYDEAESAFSSIETENLKLLGKRRDELMDGTRNPGTQSPTTKKAKPSGGSLNEKTRSFDRL